MKPSKATVSDLELNAICYISEIYYIDTSVLLESTPLVKFIRNYMRDLSGVFSLSSLVKISIISLISSLSLKLYLNSLAYDQNIFGSSSNVFGNFRQPSEIFGKYSGTFVRPLEQFWKIFGNLRKVVQDLRKIVKNAVISMPIK